MNGIRIPYRQQVDYLYEEEPKSRVFLSKTLRKRMNSGQWYLSRNKVNLTRKIGVLQLTIFRCPLDRTRWSWSISRDGTVRYSTQTYRTQGEAMRAVEQEAVRVMQMNRG